MALIPRYSLKLLVVLTFIVINCFAVNRRIKDQNKSSGQSSLRRIGSTFRDNSGQRIRKTKHWFNRHDLNSTNNVSKSALFFKYGYGGYGGIGGGYGGGVYGGYGGNMAGIYGAGVYGRRNQNPLNNIVRRIRRMFGFGGRGRIRGKK